MPSNPQSYSQYSQDIMPYDRPRKRARSNSVYKSYNKSGGIVRISKKKARRLGAVRINDSPTHTLNARFPFGSPTETVQLMYSTGLYTITGDLGGKFFCTFRGNGPWDPDLTGVGHQPKFWDALTNLYYEYFCVASEIEVIVGMGSASQGPGSIVLLPATGTVNAASSVVACSEAPYACSGLIANSAEPFRLNGYMTSYGMLGIDGKNSADISLATTIPPADACWYWNIVGTGDGSCVVNLSVKIKYTIRFSNPKWDVES